MEAVYASGAAIALISLVIWMAKRTGAAEEKRAMLQSQAKVKDAQLKHASEPRAGGADLLKRMHEGDI